MSKTPWTPGPWELEDDCYHAGFMAKNVIGGDGRLIAVIESSGDAPPRGKAALLPDDMANAHLIAAAPELYEALQECTEQLALLAKDPANPWVKQAERALRKARGEDQ